MVADIMQPGGGAPVLEQDKPATRPGADALSGRPVAFGGRAVSPMSVAVAPGATSILEGVALAVPELGSGETVMRAPRLSDFGAYARIVCGERGQYVGGPMSEEEAWDDFARMTATWLLRGHGAWTVERDGRVAGFVLIGCEPGDEAHELGFLFLPEAEGQGIAHAAAEAALAFARDTLRVDALVSYCDPENARACRLARRLGGGLSGQVEGMARFVYWGEVA